jgi:hypothetical protein
MRSWNRQHARCYWFLGVPGNAVGQEYAVQKSDGSMSRRLENRPCRVIHSWKNVLLAIDLDNAGTCR